MAHAQNEAYKRDLKRCETIDHEMMIVVDWKENYTLKGGTIATGRDFYKTVQVSIMGMIVVCKDIERGTPQKIPIVSNVLTHDGTTAIMNVEKGLTMLTTMYPGAFNSLQKIILWADSEPHYRNKEFSHYALNDMLIK